MRTPDEQAQTMIDNLEANSGKPITWWMDQVDGSGLAKHGERVAFLKQEHELGHGYANLVVHLAKQRAEGGEPDAVDLVDAQYRGKEQLRPIYRAIISALGKFGDDVEIAPKKTGVSLRRSKQFALVQPATRTRVDLGLNLGDREAAGRLERATGMCSHRIRLSEVDAVDDEVVSLLRDAYDLA